jgi:hypothetical protein
MNEAFEVNQKCMPKNRSVCYVSTAIIDCAIHLASKLCSGNIPYQKEEFIMCYKFDEIFVAITNGKKVFITKMSNLIPYERWLKVDSDRRANAERFYRSMARR